jgi:hypothetical protein
VADKYGIPAGGDPYPGKVRYYKGNTKKLAPAYIQEAVAKGGWPDKLRNTAVAVALAESGGAPYIYNTYKRGHFGLFQISRSAWPEFFAVGSEKWTDPAANARKAYSIYQAQGWRAWESYTSGRYKQFMDDSESGVMEDGGGPDGLLPELSEALDVADVLADAWEAITTPAFWMRIAYGATGVVLVVGGLMLIVRNTPAVQKATATATKAANVVPMGRAATAAKGVAA